MRKKLIGPDPSKKSNSTTSRDRDAGASKRVKTKRAFPPAKINLKLPDYVKNRPTPCGPVMQ